MYEMLLQNFKTANYWTHGLYILK